VTRASLAAVVDLARANGNALRNADVSARFGLSARSARTLLRRYRIAGYVAHVRRGYWQLTARGIAYRAERTKLERALDVARQETATPLLVSLVLGVSREYARVLLAKLHTRRAVTKVGPRKYRAARRAS
jgi:hypothetical protein